MSSREGQKKPSRSSREERENAPPVESPAVESVFKRKAAVGKGPRVWVLPLGSGEAWALPEESDTQRLAAALQENPPEVFSMRVPASEQPEALRFAGEGVAAIFRERSQEKIFALVSRLVLSGGWLLAAMLGLRLPGVAKSIDEILLLTGLGFLGYTLVWHALPLKLWHSQREDAVQSFGRGTWRHSALLDRLAMALKLRRELKVEERGQSPDTELLDANAYRKLIRDGLTTREELCALGKSIEHAMGLTHDENNPRKITDIARDCRLDPDSAIFYRDLAAHAAEIALDELAVQ